MGVCNKRKKGDLNNNNIILRIFAITTVNHIERGLSVNLGKENNLKNSKKYKGIQNQGKNPKLVDI